MADDDGHDHVNDPALVAKVSQVLLSQACQRVNFRWGKLQVTAKAYRAVVLALSDSRIDIFEADGVDHHAGSRRRGLLYRQPREHDYSSALECSHGLQSTGHRARSDPRHSG